MIDEARQTCIHQMRYVSIKVPKSHKDMAFYIACTWDELADTGDGFIEFVPVGQVTETPNKVVIELV